MSSIVLLPGAILLILGVLSGIALFVKAVSNSLQDSNSGTLWGLFIICTTAGLIMLLSKL